MDPNSKEIPGELIQAEVYRDHEKPQGNEWSVCVLITTPPNQASRLGHGRSQGTSVDC